MNVIITIENLNEVQADLIRLIAIQDDMKALKQDLEETEKIKETIAQMNKIRSEDATGTGGN
ncbi:MAG: hypothetical protein L6282_01835 [Candidatus Methanoperedenaceae archaeon]|nr:hypothetical protein [Candidatus Methanoperedenaceae archaeon]